VFEANAKIINSDGTDGVTMKVLNKRFAEFFWRFSRAVCDATVNACFASTHCADVRLAYLAKRKAMFEGA